MEQAALIMCFFLTYLSWFLVGTISFLRMLDASSCHKNIRILFPHLKSLCALICKFTRQVPQVSNIHTEKEGVSSCKSLCFVLFSCICTSREDQCLHHSLFCTIFLYAFSPQKKGFKFSAATLYREASCQEKPEVLIRASTSSSWKGNHSTTAKCLLGSLNIRLSSVEL